MNKLFLTGVFVAMALWAVGQNQEEKKEQVDGYVINGVLKGEYKADKVYLVEEESLQGESRIIDSCMVVDNRYTFKGPKVDVPKLYYIRSADTNSLSPTASFFLENGEISIQSDANFFYNSVVRGTVNNDIFDFFNFQSRYVMDSLQRAFLLDRKIYGERDYDTENAAFHKRSEVMRSRNLEIQRSFVKAYPDQVFAPFVLYWAMRLKVPVEELKELRGLLDPKLNTHPYVKQLDEFIRLAEFNVGSTIPDFTLADPNGKMISIRDFRGKYVLVDFWASWCGPCLREMPNVVKLYKEYKGKNFEILGVSLDSKKEAWVAAIKKNNMKWPQVSDLKGWNAEPARLCNVHAVPYTILLDPEGKVIALELRGDELFNKVKEVLNK